MSEEVRPSVKLTRIYPHPPERVWRALTDRGELAEWLLPGDFEPRLGHRFRFEPGRGLPETAEVACEVVEIEEARRLAYTWRHDDDEEPGRVIWTLEPVAEGTLLELVHEPPHGTRAMAEMALSGREWEWRLCVTLPTVLSRHNHRHNQGKGGWCDVPIRYAGRNTDGRRAERARRARVRSLFAPAEGPDRLHRRRDHGLAGEPGDRAAPLSRA